MTSSRSIRGRTARAVTGSVIGGLFLLAAGKHASAAPGHGHSPKQKRCDSLAHVGDSLTFAARGQLAQDYHERGWTNFRIDAKGGRGIASFMYNDMTGLEAVHRIKATGFDGCWVMALGTNDTGNADVLVKSPVEQKAWRIGLIKAMMNELDGAPVMWVNTHLISPTADYSTTDAANWNEALREVQADYPNMLIFDWDAVAAAHPEWTLPDQIHDTPEGSTQRADFVSMAATLMLRDFDPVAAGVTHVADSSHPWWAKVVSISHLHRS